MEAGDASTPPPSPSHERPLFARSSRPRDPEHELRDRAKAAKLRHRSARARLKAKRLEDRARHLYQKAVEMDTRADELDGVVRDATSSPLSE